MNAGMDSGSEVPVTGVHSTKKIYCHGRIKLGRELMLVRFNPCFLNTTKASARAPGAECSIIKDISVFRLFSASSSFGGK